MQKKLFGVNYTTFLKLKIIITIKKKKKAS